jgi:hypothetical protein
MIAEDDLFMADMVEEVLVDGGYEVCGIARTVEKAIELAERHKPCYGQWQTARPGVGEATDGASGWVGDISTGSWKRVDSKTPNADDANA